MIAINDFIPVLTQLENSPILEEVFFGKPKKEGGNYYQRKISFNSNCSYVKTSLCEITKILRKKPEFFDQGVVMHHLYSIINKATHGQVLEINARCQAIFDPNHTGHLIQLQIGKYHVEVLRLFLIKDSPFMSLLLNRPFGESETSSIALGLNSPEQERLLFDYFSFKTLSISIDNIHDLLQLLDKYELSYLRYLCDEWFIQVGKKYIHLNLAKFIKFSKEFYSEGLIKMFSQFIVSSLDNNHWDEKEKFPLLKQIGPLVKFCDLKHYPYFKTYAQLFEFCPNLENLNLTAYTHDYRTIESCRILPTDLSFPNQLKILKIRKWDGRLFGVLPKNLQELKLHKSGYYDPLVAVDVEYLPRSLERLSLKHCPVKENGLKNFPEHLKHLSLINCIYSHENLENLPQELETLHIVNYYNYVWEKNECFQNFPKSLKSLKLEGFEITEEEEMELRKQLPNLEELTIVRQK